MELGVPVYVCPSGPPGWLTPGSGHTGDQHLATHPGDAPRSDPSQEFCGRTDVRTGENVLVGDKSSTSPTTISNIVMAITHQLMVNWPAIHHQQL